VSYRYLASRPKALSRDESENWLLLRHDLKASASVLAAPLAITMLDAAGICIDPVNVCSVTHVDVDLLDPALDVREIHHRAHVTREARTMVFTESTMTDADDPARVIGFGAVNWAVIVPTEGDFTYPAPGPGIPDSPDAPPLWEAYHGRRRPDGRLEIPGLATAIGTSRLHHGPMLVVTESAALEAIGRAAGDVPIAVEHFAMTIVSPGRTGPFVATADVRESRGGDVYGSRVELRDGGHDDRLVARTFVRARAVRV
jgi:hypothetical protein